MFKNKHKSLLFVYLVTAIIIGSLSFNSCSKRSEQSLKDENGNEIKMMNVDDKNLTESDKDLKEVDYRDIYDQLSSKGKWIQVSGKDIGIKTSGSSYNEGGFQKSLREFITGVSDANASEDVDVGAFFVWQPSDNLAVGVSAGTTAAYVPYTTGQWVNTDAGWYFAAPTPEEEIVHHYGRWAYDPAAGWLWVPGRVWAPAWVDWRVSDDYVAWAPVPPSVYIVNDAFYPPPIPVENYFVVEQSHFCDPQVYQYSVIEQNLAVTTWNRPTGIIVQNTTIINRGPEVSIIEQKSGRTFDMVKINHVNNFSEIKTSGSVINTYSPSFKRIGSNEKVNGSVIQPKSFSKFDEVKQNSPRMNEQKQQTSKGNENSGSSNKSSMQQNKSQKNNGNSQPNSNNYSKHNNNSGDKGNNNSGYNKHNSNNGNNTPKNNAPKNNAPRNNGDNRKMNQSSSSHGNNNSGVTKGNNRNTPPPTQNKGNNNGSNDKKKK